MLKYEPPGEVCTCSGSARTHLGSAYTCPAGRLTSPAGTCTSPAGTSLPQQVHALPQQVHHFPSRVIHLNSLAGPKCLFLYSNWEYAYHYHFIIYINKVPPLASRRLVSMTIMLYYPECYSIRPSTVL